MDGSNFSGRVILPVIEYLLLKPFGTIWLEIWGNVLLIDGSCREFDRVVDYLIELVDYFREFDCVHYFLQVV